MPQFSLTVVPTLVQGLRCVVENHEIPENNGLPITNTVKSRAVDWSTIQFLSIFGVLLTEMFY